MLFLLNDVVFDLDEACPVTPADARRFEKLGFDYVLELGCELFSENPDLHRADPSGERGTVGAGQPLGGGDVLGLDAHWFLLEAR